MRQTCLGLIVYFLFLCANAQINITDEHCFHQSVVGQEFGVLENTSDPDFGGLLTLFVENLSSAVDSIQSVTVKDLQGNIITNKTWVKWWNNGMGTANSSNNISSVLVKGQLAPLREGDTVVIEVLTKNGHTASKQIINKTPKLRLANIIPEKNLQTVYVYVRNDDTVSYELKKLLLNKFNITLNAQNIIGGNTTIGKGELRIIKLSFQNEMDTLLLLAIRLESTQNQQPIWVSSFQRLVPAEFFFGTWDSPLFNANQEAGRKRLRELNITSVHGVGNAALMQDAFNEYHMRAQWEPPLNNAANIVQQNAGAEYVFYWNIDDEPDLNGKNIDTQLIKNFNYWLNDSKTPSYVNLCTQKKYQRYGWYSDVVSMDHYTDNGAPNVIPLSWITREGSPREAIEYTEILKRNTEPKRMTSWCQLAVKGTWKFQPRDYINNYQYWAHVMSGAKGIDYFCAKPSTKAEFPEQWNEAVRQVEQTSPIQNLLLYGEPLNNIKTRYEGDVETRMLVGKDYAVIIVLNDSIDYFPVNIIQQDWRSEIYVKNFDIEFTLPAWVSKQQIYEQTPSGKIPVQGLTDLGNNRYKISGTIFKNSRVFVFAPLDTEAPQAPQRLLFSDITAPNNYTLSWAEPHDNFGVKGYIIKVDGVAIDTVLHPIYDASAAPNICFNGYYEVIAFDEAGNKSQSAVITSPGFISAQFVSIAQQPTETTVNAGNIATFSVDVTGTANAGFQWQVNKGNGWENLYDIDGYIGSGSKILSVYATQNENGFLYRCLVNATCGINFASDSAKLNVVGSVNVEEIADDKIMLFPNPNNGVFQIKTSSPENIQLIRIFDLRGQMVKTFYLQFADEIFDINELAAGVYHVQFLTAKSVFSNKFVKQ